ncbi:cysteine and glycine-rich protein 3 [Plakobranchus ocellatus]|uniref:Cysteine and glycine-rich protein 3 n=1 Tax=Plakobranchus ocellatus TaxID=259542 RepID=A0AAV3Z8D1_9GAST|nr:cysteine and glycine-rich protein 3 [Plakobranchus ocellatus]
MPQWGGGEKCGICAKTVYAQEKIEAGSVAFHKQCFKCSVCNMTLNRQNYAQADKVVFCKKHYQSQVVAKNSQIVS